MNLKEWVKVYASRLRKDEVIYLPKLYDGFSSQFPNECRQLGFMGQQRVEPKWKNQIRQGLKLAERHGLIRHVGIGRTQEWQRT